jgi:hypothetical protein
VSQPGVDNAGISTTGLATMKYFFYGVLAGLSLIMLLLIYLRGFL